MEENLYEEVDMTKEELLKKIDSLLNYVEEDEHWEATDVAEDALSILSNVKKYLESE